MAFSLTIIVKFLYIIKCLIWLEWKVGYNTYYVHINGHFLRYHIKDISKFKSISVNRKHQIQFRVQNKTNNIFCRIKKGTFRPICLGKPTTRKSTQEFGKEFFSQILQSIRHRIIKKSKAENFRPISKTRWNFLSRCQTGGRMRGAVIKQASLGDSRIIYLIWAGWRSPVINH